MRSRIRCLVVAGALLTMSAAAFADAARSFAETDPDSIVKQRHVSTAVATDSIRGVTEPYARRRCETTKPFRCRPKRAESLTHSPA